MKSSQVYLHSGPNRPHLCQQECCPSAPVLAQTLLPYMILSRHLPLLFTLLVFCTTLITRAASQAYLQNPSRVSIIRPIKYDVTIQVPIADEENPSDPSFTGALVFEFQLDHLAEQSKFSYFPSATLRRNTAAASTTQRPSFPIYDDAPEGVYMENPIFTGNQQGADYPRNITFDTLITQTRLGHSAVVNEEVLGTDNGIDGDSLVGSVRLSAQNLSRFENVTLTSNNEQIRIMRIRQQNNEIEFITDRELMTGRYFLSIEKYTGRFGNASGMYFREIGETSTVMSVNSFPNMASSVFPCIDNFSTRTQFQLTLLHPVNSTAVSNVPMLGTPEAVGELWQRTKFDLTQPMPVYLFSFTLIPQEYKKADSPPDQRLPVSVYYNSLTVLEEIVDCLMEVTNSAFDILKELLIEELPISKLDIVLIPNTNEGIQNFGTITFGENAILNADEANMMFIVARELANLWIGGLTSIAAAREYCFMKDLSGYVAMKTLRLMTSNDQRYESFRLAHYLKIQLAENYMTSSESLTLPSQLDARSAEWRCSLKGIVMLESIETILGEEALLKHIRTILRSQRLDTFTLDDFLSLLRGYIVDGGINLAQTYDFWQKNGGFPAISVARQNDTMRLIQLHQGRLAKMGSFTWVQMPVWPIRLTLSSARTPLYFMVTEGLDLGPMPNYTVSMVNLGFDHFYRVNYDITIWKQIQSIMAHNPEQFSKRSRAQLINDFCYFNSQEMHPKGNLTEEVRLGWIKLVRDQSTKFDLCEWYIYGCEAGNHRTATPMKTAKESLWQMEDEIREAFEDSQRYACGIGASGVVANKLCDIIYGTDCL